MNKQEQIEEMVKTVVDREKNYVIGETECKKCNLNKCDLHCNIHSEISYDCETLYNAGYRKVEKVRKETAKEILQRVVTLCKNEEDFQDGHVNTQLEPLFFGIANGCAYIRREVEKIAKEYGVEDLNNERV